VNQVPEFWDSSALVPLCLQEKNSPRARKLAKQSLPVVWWASAVEIHSTVARLHRSGDLNDAGKAAALARLAAIGRSWREILPSDRLRDAARNLLDAYPLRTADSLQLAAALIWCQQKPSRRRFLCADVRLCEAAAEAGFTVVRPGVSIL